MADLWITFIGEEVSPVLKTRSDEVLGIFTICQFVEYSLLERLLFVFFLFYLTLYRVKYTRQLLVLCRAGSPIQIAELVIIECKFRYILELINCFRSDIILLSECFVDIEVFEGKFALFFTRLNHF